MSNPVVLGIDPGLNGALCYIIKDKVIGIPMPKIANNINEGGLWNILKTIDKPKMAFLEHVHATPIWSRSSCFKFGETYGIIKGILTSLSIPYMEVSPQTWQKKMHMGIPGGLKPKERSLMAAHRFFPDIEFRATLGSKNEHDGLIDAALIAQWGAFFLAIESNTDIN